MTTQTPTTRTTTLRAEGFSCPSCVAKIESKLDTLPGVQSSEVKFSSGRIIVQHDPAMVSVRELAETVTKLGYPAKPSAV